MKVTTLVFAAAVTWACAAGAHATTIIGARPCGSWTNARTDPSAAISNVANEDWLLGYISGLAMGSQLDVLRGSDYVSLYQWVDNYCRAHPRADLGDAGQALFASLRQGKGL